LIWKKSEVEGTGIRRDDWDDIYLQEFVDYQVSEERIDELGHGQYQINDAQIDEK
jgi:predicted DNA-binding protein